MLRVWRPWVCGSSRRQAAHEALRQADHLHLRRGGGMRRLLARMGFAFEDPQAEAAFLEQYVLRHRLAIQLLGVVSGLVTYAYTLLDQMLDPAHAEVSRLVRGLTLGFVVVMAGL